MLSLSLSLSLRFPLLFLLLLLALAFDIHPIHYDWGVWLHSLSNTNTDLVHPAGSHSRNLGSLLTLSLGAIAGLTATTITYPMVGSLSSAFILCGYPNWSRSSCLTLSLLLIIFL